MKATWKWTIVNGGGASGFGAFGQDRASKWVLMITIELWGDGKLYTASLEDWIEQLDYMEDYAWPLEQVLSKHWDFHNDRYRRGEADEAFAEFQKRLFERDFSKR